MKTTRVISFCMALAMCIAMLTACAGDKNMDAETQPIISQTSSQAIEEVGIVNPFTGETGYSEELLKTRPVAVMINNIGAALPQSGIADADIIYEMPVEGPVTRLMAVFSDYKSMPNIGSIRSARHDYVELLKPMNALYLHFGGSAAGKEAIFNNKIDDIDGLSFSNVAFYKDKERAKTKSSEHCWFSNGKLLQAGIEKKGFDTAMEPIASLFDFAKPGEDMMADNASAKVANEITAPISSGTKASFTYDLKTQTYSKGQNGKPHLDTNKNAAVQSTNVFLMYTDVGYLADNYHKEITMAKGTGYYISNGKAIDVTFKKASVDEAIKVYSADGVEIKVNVGKSYFCVVPNSQREKLIIQ
ncbi:MAG: DUF3048 domain-containing protein [Oscillospiraceae bacterium]